MNEEEEGWVENKEWEGVLKKMRGLRNIYSIF